jgi:adenylate cyclase
MRYLTVTRGILVGLACAGVSLLLGLTSLGPTLDDWFTDACFLIRGSRQTAARVVIIAIDEDSLDQLHKPAVYLSPQLARAVRYAHQQQAQAIGLDVFIPETLSGLKEIEEEHGIGEARSLGEAVAETKVVVLPCYYDATADRLRRPLFQWWALTALSPGRIDFGLLELTEDEDQFVRRQALVDDLSKPDPFPFFALALYARARGVDQFSYLADQGVLQVGEVQIPVGADGRMRINYVGPPGSFPVIPLSQVLEYERAGRPMPQLAGAVVILGVTGQGFQDRHPTPYANGAARVIGSQPVSLTPGPEMHAHVIATIDDQAFLTRPWWLGPIPWTLLTGAVWGIAFVRMNLTRGAGLLALFLLGLTVGSYAGFRFFGWVINPIPLACAGGLAYAVVLARRWGRLRRMMAVLESEAVTRALEADPHALDPGGEIREVTALFADIRGFTTFSERCGNDPRKVVALLNAYFATVVPAIEAEGGTVMSFMGDGLMVLFGSPVVQRDHASRAVRVAIQIVKGVRETAERWRALGFDGMKIGVGVHTGPAVVGAVGGRTRLDYTAIGDTINTASRVEGQTKSLAAEVLITADTHHALLDPELLGRCQAVPELVRLSGREGVVRLFRVES